ncbi:hypothetical protein ABZY81_43395 [Streptomyces sp. NPDC006514]|uniref:hypothetical protein n=1 Tax=Streptomyces sp. NPDC006514 TaxID=3154308 RepID=UPI0033A29955
MSPRRKPDQPTSEELLFELVEWLLVIKKIAGMSYADMAKEARRRGIRISASKFARAVDGHWMAEGTVVAFAGICGESPAVARRMWAAAHTARAVEMAPRWRSPGSTHTRGQLAGAMRRMLAVAGAPTLRELEGRAGRDGSGRLRLPRSSVAAALKRGGSRLASATLLEVFLQECGVPEPEAGEWRAARERIANGSAQPVDGPLVHREPSRGGPGLPGGHPCYVLELSANLVAERAAEDDAIRARCGEQELDWYDQQLRQELQHEKRNWWRVLVPTAEEIDEAEASAQQNVAARAAARDDLAAMHRRALDKDVGPDASG